MSKYNPKDFIAAIGSKMNKHRIPDCPYCGGNKFTTTQSFATILIGDDTKNISLGPNIPAGVVVCENCGHMEFFAMGSLGLLKAEEHDGDGK